MGRGWLSVMVTRMGIYSERKQYQEVVRSTIADMTMGRRHWVWYGSCNSASWYNKYTQVNVYILTNISLPLSLMFSCCMIGYELLTLVSGSNPGDDQQPYWLFKSANRNNVEIIACATESYVKTDIRTSATFETNNWPAAIEFSTPELLGVPTQKFA